MRYASENAALFHEILGEEELNPPAASILLRLLAPFLLYSK